jgi:hypothetical protein
MSEYARAFVKGALLSALYLIAVCGFVAWLSGEL